MKNGLYSTPNGFIYYVSGGTVYGVPSLAEGQRVFGSGFAHMARPISAAPGITGDWNTKFPPGVYLFGFPLSTVLLFAAVGYAIYKAA